MGSRPGLFASQHPLLLLIAWWTFWEVCRGLAVHGLTLLVDKIDGSKAGRCFLNFYWLAMGRIRICNLFYQKKRLCIQKQTCIYITFFPSLPQTPEILKSSKRADSVTWNPPNFPFFQSTSPATTASSSPRVNFQDYILASLFLTLTHPLIHPKNKIERSLVAIAYRENG